MRRGIIAAIVAVALFAVGAFAATFNVTSEEVASGSDDFAACATEVEVDFTTGDYSSTLGDFPVTGAEVTFDTTDCNGKDATLVVLGDEGQTLGLEVTELVAGDTASFTLDEAVADVFGAAVLVEGFDVPVIP